MDKVKRGDPSPIKLSLKTKIKSAFVGTIKLSEPEINDFLDTLKISMLESDVSYNTAELFISDLHSKLKEQKIESKRIRESIVESVRSSLFSVLYSGSAVNVDEFVEMRKKADELPVKMLFLGPNGAGKTTTIAKISHRFKEKGISNVLSASDTFRAAAIEQIEHHAKAIGVPVIKSAYGADPASIAFDAIAYAKAHGINLVLIDSAGRQETNKSLINEIQKMVRVAKPDITVFVGESTAGNQIAEQILEFNKFVKIDGIILTKLDCDAKGGGALSISHTTGIPVLFFGVGESYDALMPYNPNYIVDAIVPSSS
ncbi:MAG: signal recognition particle-docking protein FtsY [Candidatus Micrarchaeota archaeon]|nr:signal recognition particle-docking protein FtsY [Candidatus Micrarchaeota archaeon]